MTDLERARQVLEAGDYTCVLCLGERRFTSHRRGVTPLLQFIESKEDFTGFSAADKVVGKATAMLYRLLGVKAVWGKVMSKGAVTILRQAEIAVCFEQLTDHIINRTKTGPCPMEAATAHTDEPREALKIIQETLKNLQD